MRLPKHLILIICLLLFSHTSYAENYRVTLLQAAPGALITLLEEVKKLKAQKSNKLVIMRHSQGDHWDIMLLAPQGKETLERYNFNSPLAFQHTFLAKSAIDWQEITIRDQRSSLYHIEMFNAAPNKYLELVKQRHMENAYYHATQREGNVVFETTFGNDMDVFTVGFYKDLKTFATDPDLPSGVFEQAAIKAGFKSRSTIGLYLRELLSSHKDTLATKVN
jgi:hypothetical protein